MLSVKPYARKLTPHYKGVREEERGVEEGTRGKKRKVEASSGEFTLNVT